MAKNQKNKDFSTNNKGLTSPASVQEPLAAITQRLFDADDFPRAIYCQAAGSLVMIDEVGTTVAYAVTASQIIPFSPAEITTATDIATVIWW